MPVRIYDIAKKLGIESKDVLVKARELGITGAKVPSSSLDKITAEYLLEHLGGGKPVAVVEPAPAPQPVVIVSAPPEPPPPSVSEIEMARILLTAPAATETGTTPSAEETPGIDEVVEARAGSMPFPAIAPAEPPAPPKPALGEKIGFIQLPQKPAPKPVAKPGPVKLPPRPVPAAKPAAGSALQKPAARTTAQPAAPAFVPPVTGELITLKPPIVVRDLAEQIKRKPFQLIADLMELGVFANVNQSIDEITAQKLCGKYGFRFEAEKRERGAGIVHAPPKPVEKDVEDKPEELRLRAPVVTIMGHVDHGKTTLLDVIRKSNVAAKEAGGITQHIGAYTISFPHPERKNELAQITFLDTPGHAAFSSMRARGANVTDLVVLVVAAHDGVMPQTIEALNHARAAKVPVLVAVNKIDHPNANTLKVRQQLQDKGLVPDDWGGDTMFVDVSALTKQGVDKLIEMVLLQADLLELKANPNRRAKGNVIESGLEPGGPTATVLVRKGTLRVSDVIICGQYYGRVRALINEEGKRLKEANPSVAVKVLGLNGVPEAGLEFSVVEDEKAAREVAGDRAQEAKALGQEQGRSKVTLENLFATLESQQSKTLKLVVKADTQGSAEAIVEALKKIESDKVALEIIHRAVCSITDSDVALASASDAVILGFHTRIDSGAADEAKHGGVQI